jgi:PAS domain S-box-containing protein
MNTGKPLTAYLVVLGAVAIASLSTLLLGHWMPLAPSTLLLAAVVFSAWFGGLRPAVVSALLASVAKHFVIFDWAAPGFGFEDVALTVLFLFVAVMLGMLVSRLREQQEVLAVTLSSIGDAVITTDAKGRIQFLNPIAERLTGWATVEAAGQPLETVFRIIHEESRQPAANPVERVLREGRVVGMANHTLLLARSGQEIPIEDSAGPIRNASCEIIGVVMVFYDISERRERERALAQHEQDLQRERNLLRTLIDNVPDVIFTKDMEGQFVISNAAHLQLLGLGDEQEARGKTVSDLYPPELADLYRTDDLRVLEDEQRLFNREELCLDHYGQEHWHLTTKVPLRDSNGKVIGLVGISRNIDDRKQADQELRESQADLKRAQSLAHIGSWRLDLNTNELLWSDETHRIFSVAKGTPLNFALFLAAVHPEDREFVQRRWSAALCGGVYDIEHRIVVGDMVKWVRECAELESDPQGKLLSGFGTVQDITERKQASEALRRSGERFKLLAEISARLLHSERPAQILGEICASVMHQLDCDCYFNYLADESGERLRLNAWAGSTSSDARRMESLDAGLGVCGCTAQNIQQHDEPRAAFVRARGIQAYACAPLVSQDTLLGTISFGAKNRLQFSDEELAIINSLGSQIAVALQRTHTVEALSLAKEQLARANEDLENKVRERTARLTETITDLEQFSYSIAHDLRAPLRSMVSFSGLLLEEHGEKLDGASHDYLRRIAAGARRMDELVRDVLTYSQVARAELQLAPVNLDGLVKEIVAQYPQFHKDEVQIVISAPLLSVVGNVALLTQCVSNLLDNAVKFVPPSTRPCVQVWTEEQDGTVRCCVRDNGIGIEPSQLERIWRIFERCHPEGEYDGTGIGLSVVKRAVERMGGRTGVQSTPGEGSTFWFQLDRC